MYVIAGVSGHVGSVAAEALLAQGKKVRVLVRDAAKGEPFRARGAEVSVASLDDSAALARAFEGAAGAFVLLPPAVAAASPSPLEANAKVSAAIAAAVAQSKIPHVVLLSSVGAHHSAGTGPIRTLHHAEVELRRVAAAFTAVRPVYFQENWGLGFAALEHGILPSFIPKALRFAQVATADIGRTVASVLAEGPTRPFDVVELAGPREISAEDVAASLSSILGKTIVATDAPLDQVVPTFTSFGISAATAELYREMYEGIASGHVIAEAGNRSTRGEVEIETTLRALLASKK